MFARLFDQINLRSTANAALLLLLALCSFVFLANDPFTLHFWSKSIQIPAYTGRAIAALLLLVQAFYLNEYINRRHLFEGHNHTVVILGLWSGAVLLWSSHSEWLVKSFFLISSLQMIMRFIHAKELRYVFFNLGLFIGLVSFWEPALLWMLPIAWILALSLGQLHPRAFASNLLGLTAMVFFGVSVVYFFGIDAWSIWLQQLRELGPALIAKSELSQPPQWIWLIYLGLTLLLLPSALNKTNNEQRQSIQIWVILMTFALLGWLLLNQKGFWLSLGILSGSLLLAIELRQIANRWIRDGLYLVLILLHLMVILWSSGLFFS